MFQLARRNLLYDKTRFIVTITGIALAIVLVLIQLGLFLGFTLTTSGIIDHSKADLWICARGVRYFEVGFPLPARRLYQVLSVPGVAAGQKYIVKFTNWRRPDGGQENVEVIGVEPMSSIGAPWGVVSGSISALKQQDTVLVDEFYASELGVSQIGDLVEINGYRARIVGFTSGIRSFTTSPFVFTSYKNALNYTGSHDEEPTYLLVKAEPGVDATELKRRVTARMPTVDVNTTSEFSIKTRTYWLFTTGAGIALLIAALLGVVVGTTIVGQTIYATTVDHIRDFGILKAMGAPDSFVYRVIVEQAVISACIGFLVGIAVSFGVLRMSRNAGAMIMTPWQLVAGMFFLSVFMCVGASLISIHKVTRIDPAMVFRS